MEFVKDIIDISTQYISTLGMPFGFLLVFIESFIPILPLSVFVALNINAFGMYVGVLISWIATCLGGFLCYLFFYYLETKLTKRFLTKKTYNKLKNRIDRFNKLSFSKLVLLITLPFTPSFLINILAGLSKMSKEKFLLALIIGKVFMIIFWGYIGKTLIESLTDIYSLVYISVTLVVSYIVSKVLGKRFDIE